MKAYILAEYPKDDLFGFYVIKGVFHRRHNALLKLADIAREEELEAFTCEHYVGKEKELKLIELSFIDETVQ